VSTEEDSSKVLLLSDIREIYSGWDGEGIFSRDLCEKLNKLEGRPWSEWSRGKGLTQNSLSRLLKNFGVRPNSIRIGADTKKGYKRRDFYDAFSRYLPDHPSQSVTTSQPNDSGDLEYTQSVTASRCDGWRTGKPRQFQRL
jgi:hypothetical protein